MGNLSATLLNSTGALSAYGRAFNVIQNNITNANTPGYVRQDQSLLALPFDPAAGIPGGVMPGALISARNQYLEQDVRNQQQLLGEAGQRASDLGQVEPLFDPTSNAGIPQALNQFFNSFSQLAVNPNDQVARQSVLQAADQVAESFNRTALGISRVSANVDHLTVDTVGQINRLGAQIAELNREFRTSAAASHDAGLEAQMYASLEQLSTLVNFSLIKTPDGGANVYLGGQTPLVIGENVHAISAGFASGKTVLHDAESNDITDQITSGKLGALTGERNTTLPGYLAGLNQLAQTLADQVNAQLAQGVDKNGQAPAMNLFSYDVPGDAAATLAITGITPDQIAAALATAPGGNGNAIALSKMGTLPAISGFTFTEVYGNVAAQAGRDVANARQDHSQYQDLLTQAQQQRTEESGVSLDAEAAKLLQFQQAYQAVAKVVTVLDSITQTLMNMVQA